MDTVSLSKRYRPLNPYSHLGTCSLILAAISFDVRWHITESGFLPNFGRNSRSFVRGSSVSCYCGGKRSTHTQVKLSQPGDQPAHLAPQSSVTKGASRSV